MLTRIDTKTIPIKQGIAKTMLSMEDEIRLATNTNKLDIPAANINENIYEYPIK